MDVVTYALCKKYVQLSMDGKGYLKGDPFKYEDFTPEQLAALVGPVGPQGIAGQNGLSAFALAVQQGYTGSLTDWLESLKGEQGATGKSAYDLAVEQGFNGTLSAWLEQLKGADGINGINGQDGVNGQDGKSAYEIAIEQGYAGTKAEWIQSLQGKDGRDGKNYVITSSDYQAIANKVSIPKQLSQFNNDVGYITLNDVPEHECDVKDVKLNGLSVVDVNGIAQLNLETLDTTINKTFTTTTTVGHLDAGTRITADMKLADILYRILYKGDAPSTVTVYFGALDNVPPDMSNVSDVQNILDHLEIVSNKDPMELIQNGITQKIQTGNTFTEEGQYPVIALSKSNTNLRLSSWTSGPFSFTDYVVKENDRYILYYLPLGGNPSYDEDKGGQEYTFSFVEEA